MQQIFLSISAILFLAAALFKTENIQADNQSPIHQLEIISVPSLSPTLANDSNSSEIYSQFNFDGYNILSKEVFERAFLGFTNLKSAGHLDQESALLTVVDFSLPSSQNRLWVIDLAHKKILFNTLVAHGKNTGEQFAEHFSNIESSLQSSLGFYITENPYQGSNGYSLRLIGMDHGYNDAAIKRAIVMHGADYVSQDFIKNQKRLGRSWGCPAVPQEMAEPIINTIKNKSCLFVYFPDTEYLAESQWLHTKN